MASEVWNAATARMPTAAKMRRGEMGSATTASAEVRRAPATHMRCSTTARVSTATAAGMAAAAAARLGGKRRASGRCQHQTDDAGAGRDLERN